MKRLLYFLFIAGSCLPLAARAQTPPAAPPDTARVFKNELGIIAMPVIGQSFGRTPTLPLGLIYRHQVGERSAVRLIVTGYYDNRDSVNNTWAVVPPYIGRPRRVTNAALGGWLGYERRVPVAGRLSFFAGADVGLQWRKYQVRYQGTELDSAGFARLFNFWGYQDNPTWSWQGRGFAGLQVRVASRWSVAAEAAAFVAYERRFYKFEEYGQRDRDVYGGGAPPPRSLHGGSYFRSFVFRAGIRPVQALRVSYHF